MNCRFVADHWTDHFEGALSPVQDALWRAHVAICPKCPGFLESMRGTVRTLAESEPAKAPVGMKADLMARLAARKKGDS